MGRPIKEAKDRLLSWVGRRKLAHRVCLDMAGQAVMIRINVGDLTTVMVLQEVVPCLLCVIKYAGPLRLLV